MVQHPTISVTTETPVSHSGVCQKPATSATVSVASSLPGATSAEEVNVVPLVVQEEQPTEMAETPAKSTLELGDLNPKEIGSAYLTHIGLSEKGNFFCHLYTYL